MYHFLPYRQPPRLGVVDAYETSSAFTEDAFETLCNTLLATIPPTLIDAVETWYRGTEAYDREVRRRHEDATG